MTKTKWTTENIPDQSGRVAVVTGANTGLGLETARALAEHGATVVVAVRNIDKGAAAAADIVARAPKADITVQQLDLGSLASVRKAADEIRTAHDRIDLLINNAGVMYTPYTQTEDGFEMQVGVNHFGHFAFTGLLLDRMIEVEGSRVVSVSSVGHKIRSKIDFDTLNSEDGYNRIEAYGRSKLANLLFVYELQNRLAAAKAETVALAAHPGGSKTELVRNSSTIIKVLATLSRPLTQSAAMGALPTLRAAVDPTAEGGQYYGPGGIGEVRGHPKLVTSNDLSHDTATQKQLWEISEELTGVTFPV